MLATLLDVLAFLEAASVPMLDLTGGAELRPRGFAAGPGSSCGGALA